MAIDLHAHTIHSDGRLAPAELVSLARERGVRTLALTDHDTVSGLAETARAAAREGLSFVPGIEITAGLNGREIHVLGHFLVPTEPALVAFCTRMQGERERRVHRMLERLAAAGVAVSFEQVSAHSGGHTLGRPHVARALVEAGHVSHMQEAFDRFLTPGRPGWVERERPEAAEAIALIHAAGGTASVAHPGADRISKQELRALAAAGLDAVEAVHPAHPPSQAEAYERWGREAGLFVTGGSDFHGPPSEETYPGLRSAPARDLALLQARSEARQAAPALAGPLAAWTLAVGGGGEVDPPPGPGIVGP